jgi:hypothetical protein
LFLLVIGHFSLFCIEGIQLFEYAGRWAVIIFLLLSGIAITVKYGIKDIGATFVKKRIQRFLFPV